MFALARALLVGLVACDIAWAFFIGEGSQTIISTAVVNQQSALAPSAAKRRADVEAKYASAVDRNSSQDRGKPGDEAINAVGRSDREGPSDRSPDPHNGNGQGAELTQDLLDPSLWEKAKIPSNKGSCKIEVTDCKQTGSLIHEVTNLSSSQIYYTYSAYQINYVHAPLVLQAPPVLQAPAFPVSTRPTAYYLPSRVWAGSPLPIHPNYGGSVQQIHQQPIRVGFVQTPSHTFQTQKCQLSPDQKKQVVKRAVDEFKKEEKWTEFFKDPRAQILGAALDGLTGVDAYETILKWYDILEEKSRDRLGDSHPIEINSGVPTADVIEILAKDDETIKALQEACLNADQIPVIHDWVREAGHFASQEMHQAAFALGDLGQHVPHPALGAVVHSSEHAWVGTSTIDPSVNAGSDAHLLHLAQNVGMKCARTSLYNTMVGMAESFSRIQRQKLFACADLFCDKDCDGRQQPNTGRLHLESTIYPLRKIADAYQEDCLHIQCTGGVQRFHQKVNHFVSMMHDILSSWLSYSGMPSGKDKSRRIKVMLAMCQKHIVSLAMIIGQKLPAFLDLWYDTTIDHGDHSIQFAWITDAQYLSDKLDEYLLVTSRWEWFQGYLNLNDIHQEMSQSFA